METEIIKAKIWMKKDMSFGVFLYLTQDQIDKYILSGLRRIDCQIINTTKDE